MPLPPPPVIIIPPEDPPLDYRLHQALDDEQPTVEPATLESYAGPDLDEVLRNVTDQRWRLRSLYTIQTKDGTLTRFVPNWAQERLFDSYWWNTVILKARQLGMSTGIHVLFLDTALWVPRWQAGIQSYDLRSCQSLMRRNIFTPFDQLHPQIRALFPVTKRTTTEVEWAHGSRIIAGTTLRGDTLQAVHVSELGRTAANFPAKAQEVITGTLETVGVGKGLRIVESTAEGDSGEFYDMCMAAQEIQQDGARQDLLQQDYRLLFLPWWQHPEYQADPATVAATRPTPEEERYFLDLEPQIKRTLEPEKRAWYIAKRRVLRDRMFQEYPSTAGEAFQASLEGTYYLHEYMAALKTGRVCELHPEPGIPLVTGWDLGVDDYTAIWIAQRVGREARVLAYIEDCGRGLAHYTQQLFEYNSRGLAFSHTYLPHDARNRRMSETGTDTIMDLARRAGLPGIEIVDTPDKAAGIETTRQFWSVCRFDRAGCELGLKRLRSYRKQKNRLGSFTGVPEHDEASHGADAFRMLAQGWYRDPQSWAGTYQTRPNRTRRTAARAA